MTRKEAITAIRCFMCDLTDGCQEALMVAIPELVESKDERIRKELVTFFKEVRGDYWHDLLVDDILAYLEKQKPRKFKLGDKVHWYDDDTNVITITGFRDDAYLTDFAYGLILFGDENNWERIEQKTAEGSGDYNEEDLQTRFAFYTYKDEPGVLFLSNLFVEEASRKQGLGTKILKAAERVAETVGASSIMLRAKLGTPVINLYNENGFELFTEQGGYGWFEKKLNMV